MSLIDALLDDNSKYQIHCEVRDVAKEYEHNENFTVIGELCMHSFESVGQGDPGYFAKLYDRLDKKLYMNIFISEADLKWIENEYYAESDCVVCVWGKKVIRKFGSTKTSKQIIDISYQTLLVRPYHFMARYDMI
jgi:hypothetical protein